MTSSARPMTMPTPKPHVLCHIPRPSCGMMKTPKKTAKNRLPPKEGRYRKLPWATQQVSSVQSYCGIVQLQPMSPGLIDIAMTGRLYEKIADCEAEMKGINLYEYAATIDWLRAEEVLVSSCLHRTMA